ncbi:MAG TPA: hypothetical protein VKC99_01740 [Methyloceanibacter sp.]|jgi:hypothetical protein|nr:hypothetical protein [Methyloceanibacter sp.]
MLQRFGEFISACLQRADECSKVAASETNDRVRSQLLELEQQWQHLAKSYEFIETLERFVLASHTLPEVEKLPKDFPPE